MTENLLRTISLMVKGYWIKLLMFIMLPLVFATSLLAQTNGILQNWNSLKSGMSWSEAKPIIEKMCFSNSNMYGEVYEDCNVDFLGVPISSIEIEKKGWLLWKKVKWYKIRFNNLRDFNYVDKKLFSMFSGLNSNWDCYGDKKLKTCYREAGKKKGFERGQRYLRLSTVRWNLEDLKSERGSVQFCEDPCF